MAYYTWSIFDSSSDITSQVRSFSYFLGRRSVDDITATTTITMTLINNNESLFPLTINEELAINYNIGLTTYAQLVGRVASMSYADQPGTGNDSSVTVTAMNALGLVSSVELTGGTVAAGTIANQITSLNTLLTAAGSGVSVNFLPIGGTSTYNMAAQTFTGSPTDYVRTLANADNSILHSDDASSVSYFSFAEGFANPGVTFGRTPSSTQLGYAAFRRRRFEKPFYNQVTVSSSAVAAQTATNATSTAAVGRKAYNVDTFFSTTAQAATQAQYYANAFSSDQFSFEVDFLVEAQDDAVWTQAGTNTTSGVPNASFFATCLFLGLPTFVNLSYLAPGAASQTVVPCIIEGVQINATPNSTRGTVYLSPATYYSQFVLDNTFFGVLDQDRLG